MMNPDDKKKQLGITSGIISQPVANTNHMVKNFTKDDLDKAMEQIQGLMKTAPNAPFSWQDFAKDIVSVQPMSMPSTKIFAMDFQYDKKLGHVTERELRGESIAEPGYKFDADRYWTVGMGLAVHPLFVNQTRGTIRFGDARRTQRKWHFKERSAVVLPFDRWKVVDRPAENCNPLLVYFFDPVDDPNGDQIVGFMVPVKYAVCTDHKIPPLLQY